MNRSNEDISLNGFEIWFLHNKLLLSCFWDFYKYSKFSIFNLISTIKGRDTVLVEIFFTLWYFTDFKISVTFTTSFQMQLDVQQGTPKLVSRKAHKLKMHFKLSFNFDFIKISSSHSTFLQSSASGSYLKV